jgi:hypothetical protein
MPPLRVLVVSLVGLFPAAGYAQSPWQSLLESQIDNALKVLRPEKPRRTSDLHIDNLNLWQPGLGFGAQVEVSKNWVVRLDLERQRPKFPGGLGRENLDTVTLAIQYWGD